MSCVDENGFVSAGLEHGKHPVSSVTVLAFKRAMMPPITTMPCTKFDPDIRGVWRIAGTFPIMTQPPNAASMKMYVATKPVIAMSKCIEVSLVCG
jgi:hypothetical protein